MSSSSHLCPHTCHSPNSLTCTHAHPHTHARLRTQQSVQSWFLAVSCIQYQSVAVRICNAHLCQFCHLPPRKQRGIPTLYISVAFSLYLQWLLFKFLHNHEENTRKKNNDRTLWCVGQSAGMLVRECRYMSIAPWHVCVLWHWVY